MLLKLTAPDGTPVELESAGISARRPNNPPNDYHPDAKSVLTVAGEHFAVKETLDAIERMIAKG